MALTAKLINSLVGQQGLRGATTRLTSGTPAASVGNDGDIAVDYATPRIFPARSNGAWSGQPVSLVGAKGDQGVVGVASAGVSNYLPVAGPEATYVANTSATTAGSWIPFPSQGYPLPFMSAYPTYFCGSTFVVNSGSTNASGCKFSLRNYNTNAVIYTSPGYSYGTVNSVGNFGTSYPLAANTPYCWYLTGAGAAAFMVRPFYLVPATNNSPSIMQMHSAYLPSQTMSSTAVPLRSPGGSTSSIVGYSVSPVYALLYEATLYNGGTGTVVYQLYNSASSSIVYSLSVPSGGEVNVGPFPDYSYRVPNGNQVYWRATGSGNGSGWVQWRCWV